MSTGTPISSNGSLITLPDPRRGAGYHLYFQAYEVIIDAPIEPSAGASAFDLRTDASASKLPEGWIQRPFPAGRPTYWFPAFEKLLFAGTAPGVVTDPEPWVELAKEAGEGTLVFSAFPPPVTLGGWVRLFLARRRNVARAF